MICWGVHAQTYRGQATAAADVPSKPSVGDALEHVAVAVAALVWLLVVTRSSGGLHDPRTAWLSLALVPAVVATRPWRHVQAGLLVLIILCAMGAGVVLMVTPVGWGAADSPASQLTGFVALAVTAAYARTPTRRRAVVGVLAVALVLQFSYAWLPWWGSGDPHHLMVGSFYWHNQYAAWLVGTALTVGAVGVCGPRDLRLPALVAMPFADAGVVLSTSRASLGLLMLGHVGLLALAAACSDRRGALLRAVAMPLAGVGLLALLTSSVFFPPTPVGPVSDAAPATATAEPDAGGVAGSRGIDTLGTSGRERVEWSRAALGAWWDAPAVGNGFGSFPFTSAERLPPGLINSAYAHNAFAEALGAGGLVFGLPLILLAAGVAGRAVQILWRTLRNGATERGVEGGAALATLALLAHSGFDFDWHYASLTVLFGVVAGLILARSVEKPPRLPRGGGATLAALLVAVLGLSALATHVEQHGRTFRPQGGNPSEVVHSLLTRQIGPLYDGRAVLSALRNSISVPATGPDRLAIPAAQAREVLRRSGRVARIQPATQVLRAELMALVGDKAAARTLAEDVVRRHGVRSPGLYVAYAETLALTGDNRQARSQLLSAAARAPDGETSWTLLSAATRLTNSSAAPDLACAFDAATKRFGPSPPTLARPVGGCT